MTAARGRPQLHGASAGSGPVVFLSYSREDAGWMERFVKMLEPERRGLGLEVWFDTVIATGREWRADIEAAIARADVALLLVSSDFLASSFIVEQELPALVARKVPLACALLRRCRYAAVDDLERVQWAHDPVRDGPIAMAGDVDGAIADVVAALIGMLDDARPAGIRPTARPERAERVRFNLPPVAPSFTGREEELAELDAKLGQDDRALITQAITGLGGVGKSQLAARYAGTRSGAYDVVAWIGAEDGGIADLSRLAVGLGLRVDELAPGDRARAALDWLAGCDRRWLLVLDNVESAEQLKGLLPRGERGRVLVTSRDRTLRQFGPVLAVDVFDEDTATRYLTERAERFDDERGARELARALGYLPLALAHAAAYCGEGTSFTDYRLLLDGLPAVELFDSQPDLSYAQTVASTWKPSIAAAGKLAPLAGTMLDMAAYLAPDAIPKALFEVLVDDGKPAGRKRLTDAFNALARYSLATVDDSTVGVHRLLQKIVRDDHDTDEYPAGALSAIAAVDARFPEDVALPAGWALCEQLLPHALALADTPGDAGDAGARIVDLLNRVSRYLHYADPPGGRSLATAKATLAHARRLLPGDPPHALMSRSCLATAYQWAGRPDDAIAIFEPLLADYERILGDAHPSTLSTRNNLALAYQAAGRVGDAIAIYDPLLADFERILGTAHPSTLITRHNLGLTYQAAGRVADAIAIFEPLVADRERILGAEHPAMLTTRASLASAYRASERVADAIAIFEPLLADSVRILGAEHPSTLSTRNNLACAYQSAGRVADAIAIFEPLLAESERILGAEDPSTSTTRRNLAAAYDSTGRTDAARRLRGAD
jgi:tetratricopeptide (TPR) repeat protein